MKLLRRIVATLLFIIGFLMLALAILIYDPHSGFIEYGQFLAMAVIAFGLGLLIRPAR